MESKQNLGQIPSDSRSVISVSVVIFTRFPNSDDKTNFMVPWLIFLVYFPNPRVNENLISTTVINISSSANIWWRKLNI